MSAPPTDLVDLPTAAADLNRCPRTVRRWIDGGRLPGYRVGVRSVRVARGDVEALRAALEAPRRIEPAGVGA